MRKFAMFACYFVLVVSEQQTTSPSKGSLDDYTSVPLPTLSALPFRPWRPSCPKFESFDKCWRKFCPGNSPEYDFLRNLKTLKAASDSMDIAENFLIELATQYPDNCLNEMKVVKSCFQKNENVKNEKIKINTFKTSEVRNVNDTSGKVNCITDQIKLEKCIIEKNRYHPCPPAYRDFSDRQEFYNEWNEGLAKILKPEGIEVVEETTSDGELHLNIGECSEKFEKLALNYRNELPCKKLPDLYDSISHDLLSILFTFQDEKVPLKAREEFAEAVKNALYRREILDIDETMQTIIENEKNYKNPIEKLKNNYFKFNKDFRNLLELFPKQVQKKCLDEKKHQEFIRNKINLVEETGVYGWYLETYYFISKSDKICDGLY